MDPKEREFKYRYRIVPSDLWQIRMYYAYASYLAVVNIICIVASIVLIVTLWATAAAWFRIAMLIFLSLFTVIQPLFIYFDSRRSLKNKDEELELIFNRRGLMVNTGGKSESYDWKRIINVAVRPTLVAVYTDASHGYILTNRILKDSRRDFIAYLRLMRGASIA